MVSSIILLKVIKNMEIGNSFVIIEDYGIAIINVQIHPYPVIVMPIINHNPD